VPCLLAFCIYSYVLKARFLWWLNLTVVALACFASEPEVDGCPGVRHPGWFELLESIPGKTVVQRDPSRDASLSRHFRVLYCQF
jgi:hypothetical protein